MDKNEAINLFQFQCVCDVLSSMEENLNTKWDDDEYAGQHRNIEI